MARALADRATATARLGTAGTGAAIWANEPRLNFLDYTRAAIQLPSQNCKWHPAARVTKVTNAKCRQPYSIFMPRPILIQTKKSPSATIPCLAIIPSIFCSSTRLADFSAAILAYPAKLTCVPLCIRMNKVGKERRRKQQ